MEQKNRIKSLVMLITAMLMFGMVGILRKKLPLPSALIACCRGLIGSLFLLVLTGIRGKKPWQSLSLRTIGKLLLTGAIIGLNWDCLFEGDQIKGILFALCAAGLYSSIVLLNKSIRDVDPYAKTILQLGMAGIVQIPYLLITGDYSGGELSFSTICLLLILCLVFTGVSYMLYFGSMDGLRTQTIALFSYIDPLSALILGERLSVYGWIGAVLILGSAILCEIFSAKEN